MTPTAQHPKAATAPHRMRVWPSARLLQLSDLPSLNFGEIPLTDEQQALRRLLNSRIPALCGRMPGPLCDSALIALQMNLNQGSALHVARFYDKYYVPAWTVIPYLAANGTVDRERVLDALGSQAYAMLLHLLDDHLTDGDLPADHLFLQLRTEAWSEFRACLGRLGTNIPEADRIAGSLIDRYFAHIHRPPVQHDLAAYEAVFRGQSATWLIAPLLTATLAGYGPEQRSLLRDMYEEFCLAWRVLDDLRDCETDAAAGTTTAVYHLLPPSHQPVWQGLATAPEDSDRRQALLDVLCANGYPAAARLIRTRLSTAANHAHTLGLDPLAEQYRLLARPLEHLEERP
ncbi:hypothetical protein [Streptomyces sirii]|uniref:hypothetical protein n=1 Tax=Streptomyces sirii TaxID=3127701 RepID=UPI003D35D471